MANPKYAELVFPFDLGLDESSVPERVAADSFTLQRNTRLSVQPGAPVKSPAETTIAAMTGSPQIHGLAAAGDSVIAFFDPATGQRRVLDNDVTQVLSTADNAIGTNRYLPTQIEQSGAVCGDFASGLPAVTIDADGNVWYAYVKRYDTMADGHLYVTVYDSDGDKIIPSRRLRVVGPFALAPWVGLTYTTAGGVVVWWRDDSSGGQISAAQLTLDADRGNVTFGAQTPIYTPLASYTASLCSDGELYAFLMTRHSSTVDRLSMRRVDTSTLTVLTGSVLPATTLNAPTQYMCCDYVRTTAGEYILYAWSGSTPVSGYGVMDAATFGPLWNAAGPAIYGPVACAASVNGAAASNEWSVFAVSECNGYVGTVANYSRTVFSARRLDGTIGTPTKTVPWMRIYDTGCTWVRSRSNMFALFGLARCYQNAALPDDLGFVEDPCVEQFLVYGNGAIAMAPVSRYGAGTGTGEDGVDLTQIPTLTAIPLPSMHGRTSVCVGDKLYNTYLQFRGYPTGYVTTGYVPIFVRTSLEGGAFRSCPDTRGGAIVVASKPWYWDGAETVEQSVAYRPKVKAVPGAGPATGLYAIRAVYTWRNAFGEVVRSAPSTAVTFDQVTTQLWISLPSTMRDGEFQAYFDIDLYIRDVNADSLYYLYRQAPTSRSQDGCFYYSNIIYAALSGLNPTPALYSTGGAGTQLLPNAPQPLWDAALVGKRLIGIDAETRTTVVVSKEKEVGIALEFASELNLAVDGSAGRLTAASEMGGDAVILAERGIYAVAGDARDNLGNGNGFDRPRIVSDMGCTDKLSVVRCPAGILFRTIENNFALWSGGGLTVFDKIVATSDVVGSAVFAAQDEVVFFFAGGTRKAFNYRLMRWSEWTMSTVPDAVVQCADGTVVYYTNSTSFVRMDPAGYSASAQMGFATGWIIPESDQGDCTFSEVLFQAIYSGSHGLQLEIAVDYGDYDDDLRREWDATELASFKTEDDRYTVGVSLQRTARAIRVRVTELAASGDGMRPLSCTLCYSSTGRGHQRTAVMRDGQMK